MTWHALAHKDQWHGTASREFELKALSSPLSLFVVSHEGLFYAYINACPHTGVSLNWSPDVFLDIDHQYIQCATHGALFRIDDGLCIRGPCVRQSLTSLKTEIKNEVVHVEVNL